MRRLEGVFADPEHFDFFHLCRRFEAASPLNARLGEAAAMRDDIVRFGQEPWLAFPVSTVAAAFQREGRAPEVRVKFMGLLGPQGGMPLSLTDEARHYAAGGDDSLCRFMDVLNHRFIQLFFRAWADSRPVAHRDRIADDRFERYVASHIGLGSAPLRDLDSVPDAAKAAYAGIMSPRVKSCSRLRDVVAGLFGVRVDVQEFVGMRLLFEPGQLSRIGQGFANLGRNVLLGAGVYSVQDKFRLRLSVATLAEYKEFLPSGKKARKLAELVIFYIGTELEWDVELALPVGEVEPVRLGKAGQLGWTTWMAPNWAAEIGGTRSDARFDLARRFGGQATI